MRLVRAMAVLALAVVLVAASSWWPTLDWRLSLDGWQVSEDVAWNGYVEAEFVDVAAEETARLVAVSVERGDRVGDGDPLFRLDSTDAMAACGEARARLEMAEAELQDLLTGKRPQEIEAVEAQRDAAAATLEAARQDYERKAELVKRKIVSEAQLDEASERFRVAEARLDEAEHQLAVARLPARPGRIEAARKNVDAARAAVGRVEARLARLSPAAPVAAHVEELFFRPGELVPAGRPVVRLLPRDRLKVRFFVPEPELGRIAVGDAVALACDGCGAPVAGTIVFIAEEAEFTPPVIFSVSARQKLVYLVEVRPQAPDRFKVGQPVDVRLSATRGARR
jgi:HlyD family secretion protein